MEKKTLIIASCVMAGASVGVYLFKRFAWPKLQGKLVQHEEEWWEAEEIEENIPKSVEYIKIPSENELQEKSTLNGFEKKPDIAYITYSEIASEYKKPDNASTESVEPEETMPYMCTVHEYLDEWPYYKKCTLSWYPEDHRLVNLDDGFEVIMPPYQDVVGVYITDILDGNAEWVDEAYYAVDKNHEKCYEILKVEDSSYEEDLNDFKNINGGA